MYHALIVRIGDAFRVDAAYVVRGNFWLLIARVAATGTGVLLTIVFANLLAPEAFGFYKYAISMAGIITAFSLTGIGTALINSIARGDEGTIRSTLRTSFLWSLPASALALAAGGYYLYQGNGQLALSLLAIAIATPIFASFGNYRHLFIGRADFRASAIIGTVRSLVPVLALIITVFLTQDPLLIVLAYFASNAGTVLLLYFYTIWRYRVPQAAASTKSTVRFAWHTSAINVLTQITSQADQFLMWHFAGPAAVAYYAFATSPIYHLQSISGNLFSLTAPKMATKSEEELGRMIPTRMRQMFLLMIPFTAAYVIAAPYIFHYLFPQYESVAWLSQIYAVVLLLQPQGFVDAALIAQEDTRRRNRLIVAGQTIKLTLLVAGIIRFGITGGIGALVLAEIANFGMALAMLAHMRRRRRSAPLRY